MSPSAGEYLLAMVKRGNDKKKDPRGEPAGQEVVKHIAIWNCSFEAGAS